MQWAKLQKKNRYNKLDWKVNNLDNTILNYNVTLKVIIIIIVVVIIIIIIIIIIMILTNLLDSQQPLKQMKLANTTGNIV